MLAKLQENGLKTLEGFSTLSDSVHAFCTHFDTFTYVCCYEFDQENTSIGPCNPFRADGIPRYIHRYQFE